MGWLGQKKLTHNIAPVCFRVAPEISFVFPPECPFQTVGAPLVVFQTAGAPPGFFQLEWDREREPSETVKNRQEPSKNSRGVPIGICRDSGWPPGTAKNRQEPSKTVRNRQKPSKPAGGPCQLEKPLGGTVGNRQEPSKTVRNRQNQPGFFATSGQALVLASAGCANRRVAN